MPIKNKRWDLPACFVVLGAILLTGTFFYNFIVPQTPGRMLKGSAGLIDALSVWRLIAALPIPIPAISQQAAAWLVLSALATFAAYGTAVYLSWGRRGRMALIVVVTFTFLFLILSTWALPNVNSDIYYFILNGRVAAVYESNPYYVPADQFPDDPIYPYADSKYTSRPADKLPAWMLLSVLLARAAGDDPVTNLMVFRSTLLLFNLANIALITAILHELQPQQMLAGVMLYAWNPIVVVFGQSKVDTVMVFFLLLAVFLLVRRRDHLAILSLVLSVLVKLITLPLLGVFLISYIRLRKWRRLLIGALLIGGPTLLLYALFWRDSNVILAVVDLVRLGGAAAPDAARFLLQAVFALLVLVIGFAQDGRLPKLLWGWAVVTLYFSLFLTQLGFAWYLTTLITLVALKSDRFLGLMTLTLSFSAFLLNTWDSTFSPAFSAPDLIPLPRYLVYVSLPLLVGLGAAVWTVWRRWQNGRNPQFERVDKYEKIG